jgi:hypothetical protein
VVVEEIRRAMPLPAPKPLDALRQHTHAVVLTAGDAAVSDFMAHALQSARISCDFIRHPLLAMARLTTLARGDATDRPALVVTDRQIDDLSPLFSAIRNRLGRVSIWVFEAELAIEVQRGHSPDVPAPPAIETPARASSHTPPALRIAGVGDAPAAALGRDLPDAGPPADRDADPLEPSGENVTAAELKMLLELFEPESDDAPSRDGERP